MKCGPPITPRAAEGTDPNAGEVVSGEYGNEKKNRSGFQSDFVPFL
jgi:hypothetical protein